METTTLKTFMDEETKRLHVVGELAPDDFDKSGKMTVWKMSRFFQSCRFAYLDQSPWFSLERFRVYVRHQKIDFLPAFSEDIDYATPLKVTIWLSFVGNTSFVWDYVVTDYITGIQLAKAKTQMVWVDAAVRGPTRVPDEFRERLVADPKPLVVRPFPSKPASYFKFKLSVASSDTDLNQHTNQAVYIRMCMDAVSAGALKGQFSFPKELVYYNPRSVAVNYVKESKMEDCLEIACWEDQSNPISVFCEITKGSEIVCQCQLEFDYDVKSKL
ncbi:uncharacterized protein [Amphiura filiformis]|uniref:uncharacterized protein n=1 Tax=Amphiura filiformis TaxID=82378 RepID=UPI003B21E781